jgi:type I restriction enzyme, S subunit
MNEPYKHPLSEYVKVEGGYAFKSSNFVDNGIPIIRISNLTKGYLNLKNSVKYPAETLNEFQRYLVKEGDILIAMSGATTGKVGIAKGLTRHAFLNQRVGNFKIKDSSKLNKKFLYYILTSQTYQKKVKKIATGCAQPNISSKKLEDIKINIPSLKSQEKIVKILEKAEKLKDWRTEADKLTEEYLNSIFLEMFGDTKKNPYNWEQMTVNDIATKVTDGEHKTPKRSESGIKLLSARNVRNGFIDLDIGLDYVPIHEYERIKNRCNPEYGDILISCSGAIIGRVATVRLKEPLALVRSAALIKPLKKLVNSTYLEFYLRTPYLQLFMKNSANASGQPNLFTGPLKKVPVLLPPLNLQKQFENIVKKLETLKNYQTQSKIEIDTLFNTLMQKTFKGELAC